MALSSVPLRIHDPSSSPEPLAYLFVNGIRLDFAIIPREQDIPTIPPKGTRYLRCSGQILAITSSTPILAN